MQALSGYTHSSDSDHASTDFTACMREIFTYKRMVFLNDEFINDNILNKMHLGCRYEA